MLFVILACTTCWLFCSVTLESSIDQWQAYDKNYDNLSHWLKDMEARVRNEATLKPDLPGKVQQLEEFKVGQGHEKG